MKKENHFGIIMAGGVGSRFWPMSRKNKPKQFLDIFGTGKSLFLEAFERLLEICPKENIYIVTNESYRKYILEQIDGLDDNQILGEPMAKNTAPCIAYASYKIHKKCPDATISVLPSDHLILDKTKFITILAEGYDFVDSHTDALLTLGITPTRPDTGYGYIQKDEKNKKDFIFKVKTFTEKPSLDVAKHFLKSGEYLWNSGMFVWKSATIIKEFKNNLPELDQIFEEGNKVYFTDKEADFIELNYQFCTNISIDFGIMEKSNEVYVLPASFGWSDIGTWAAMYEYSEKDENANVIMSKKAMIRNTTNCVIHTENIKLIALNGINNLIIVEKDGILLIGDKDKEQEIRNIVNDVKSKFGDKFI
jgi:mannose-1-phosphate guanylyltransferase